MFLLIFLIFSLIFVIILLFVIFSAFLGFVLTRVPFVPTRGYEIEFIIDKLNISSNDVFYDLGSGDGKVCFLVNHLTGAKCVGFELTWWTYALSVLKLKCIRSTVSADAQGGEQSRTTSSGRENQNAKLQFKMQNFFKTDWSEANFVYAYLYPTVMGMVEEKFMGDCKPGSIAIVRDFPFPNLKPQQIYKMPKRHEIYIYKKL